MTATAHALIGGAIAASVPDPKLGITLAAISHPIVDMIPHWDFGWGWKRKSKPLLFLQASFDLILGIFLAFLLFGKTTNTLYLLTIIFVSESWDILQAPYWFLGWKFFPFSTIYNFQHEINGKVRLPWGILTQVVTVTGFCLALRAVH